LDDWLDQTLDELTTPETIAVERRLESNAEARIDRERLRRCVANVISNAMEAMAPRPGDQSDPRTPDFLKTLTVSTRLSGERVEIRIADTGPGMTPEEIEKAFEPLYSTKSHGVGLGLPAVRRVMEQLGGGVDIASEEGAGVEVVLWLPVGVASTGMEGKSVY
ncbi:MAG: ATP-binding protein, partial [Desulfobacterales bacterium]|nr:ATP-binding protein [Desulfobacterales bacterium]